LIPKASEYIQNYTGGFERIAITDDMLDSVLGGKEYTYDYEKLYDEGLKRLENNRPFEVLKYFNTARAIEETPDVLFCIGVTLFNLCCFDRAIPFFKRVIQMNGEELETLEFLVTTYDFAGDREKTLEYCSRIVNLLSDSEEDVEKKIYYYNIMFDVYVYLRDENKAREVMNTVSSYSSKNIAKQYIMEMGDVMRHEFGE
jgi:tetratricopeptide (TPR) repeat protein